MKDTTKQRIQELVPSVMEIKFGCEYSFIDRRYPGRAISWLNWNESEIPGREHKIEVEILGSPITLAVVLQAIEKKKSGISIDSSGRFQILHDSGLLWAKESNGVLAITWDLTHDSYDEQSDYTKRFIGDLLNN